MPEPQKTKLPREVWLLGGVSFFADVSSEMIYPLLPLFVVVVLGATATDLGWIEGIASGIVALLTAYAGIRSDRRRRRVPWVRWGYGLPVAGKSILAAALSWPMVLLGRTVDRVGKGLRGSPRDALITDVTPKEIRGRAFGLHRTMDTAGALVGVLAAAVLMWWLAGTPSARAATGAAHAAAGMARAAARPYRIIFAISAAMGLASLALTFMVREPAAHVPAAAAAPRVPAPGERLSLPRAYWIVLAMLVVFALANSSDTFLLLRADQVGLTPWSVVIAYAVYNVVYTAASYPAGVMSDRFGRWRVIGAGWAIYALVYGGFAVASTTTIWPLFASYGLYMALTDGVGKALIADHAPPDRRGRALGVFYLATGATALASSIVAGVLWDRVGPSAPFWLGAGAAVLALVILIVAAASGWLGRKA